MAEYQFEGLDPFEARRAKHDAWRALGIDPYPPKAGERQWVEEVRKGGEGMEAGGEPIGEKVGVGGRIMALRNQGALCFMDVRDETGTIQVLVRRDAIDAEWFERLALLDIGDFVFASGQLFITRRGELTVAATEWRILTKSLRPLPDLWRGLQDIDQRQRQRYAELIVNDEVRERFYKRSRFTAAIRQYLIDHKFTEVETPVLEHTPGGADAEPFITHHNALDTDFYLRISLELHLKRLTVGGFERNFELSRVFRNEGVSPQHLQEFTELEFYYAYATYEDLIPFLEGMYVKAIQDTFGTLQITRGDKVLDFTAPWPRRTYRDLLLEYAGIDILTITDEELVEHVKKHRVDTDVSLGRGRLLDQLYKKTVRPFLVQPMFMLDHPVEISPLAKRKPGEPRLTERLQILIDGAEVGNGFSELNDPIDQRGRFEEQEKLRMDGDPEAMRMDTDFLRALEYGMPPTAGFGVGIDRLFAIVAGVDSIRETVFFPTMRPESD